MSTMSFTSLRGEMPGPGTQRRNCAALAPGRRFILHGLYSADRN